MEKAMIHWWLAQTDEFVDRTLWAVIIAVVVLMVLGLWKTAELILGLFL